MIKRWLFPLLAIIAIGWSLTYVFFLGNKKLPPAQPLVIPTQSEFQNYISASGIVESATENISIGTNIPGIVSKIYVSEGQKVKAGDPLFTLDDREAQAELSAAAARADAALAQVKEASAQLDNVRSQYQKIQAIGDTRAFSKDELDQQMYNVKTAEARVISLNASAKSARADAEAAQVNLNRLTVTAPVAGEILSIKIRPGEYASAGALSEPLILLGDTETLHIRADIDENDAWRYTPGAKAHANLRGNPDKKVELAFVRVQPYVVPKRSLTGSSNERVDTRVLQVLYSFPQSELNAYVGQLMDVFIDAEPVAAPQVMPAAIEDAGSKE
ncbi:MAG TPA: secretion protein HlyD [Rhodospirillaceae bacterium]|nr:secretion protein HlyD [Rhodospirillaceae bacterium]